MTENQPVIKEVERKGQPQPRTEPDTHAPKVDDGRPAVDTVVKNMGGRAEVDAAVKRDLAGGRTEVTTAVKKDLGGRTEVDTAVKKDLGGRAEVDTAVKKDLGGRAEVDPAVKNLGVRPEVGTAVK